MYTDRNIDDIQPDEEGSDEGKKGNIWATLGGFVAVAAIVAGIFFTMRGCDNWRSTNMHPDRVHGAYLGTSAGRPLLFILSSVMMNEDDSDDRLNDSSYRVDVYDLALGKRLSQMRSGEKISRWIGSNGAIAWLQSRERAIGLNAYDIVSGKRLIEEKELIEKNPHDLTGPLDSAWYDGARDGVVVHTSGGRYYLIDAAFKSHPAEPASYAPPRSSDSDGIAAFPSALLGNGTELRIANGKLERAGGSASAGAYTRGGFLHDAATGRPIEPSAPGSCIVLHFESADDAAPYLLTALAPDGSKLWSVGAASLESKSVVRAALRYQGSLLLITDRELIYLDIASGKRTRRIEL